MFKFLSVSCLLLMLVGCGASHEVVVEKITTNYVTLDDSWLSDCPTVPPPDELVYTKATLQQRVDMLSATYLEQAKLNRACRVRTTEARKYNALKREQQDVLVCKEGKCQ